ncbi:uncharacterized protein METZ01_LOCUS178223 [marine metagenome]|uniref:Uncharacterized protein n=1 Tax=marine metagenome TaxID=408172 RepID=A0A382CHR3_9ZZZZ
MTSKEIRNYCEEALAISSQQGTQDALTFLIGEKLSLIYYQLKTERNKLKFLYPENFSNKKQNQALKQNKNLQLSYTLTINKNYIMVFRQVKQLEKTVDLFVSEIKKSFPLRIIQDFLTSSPRLASKEDRKTRAVNSLEESSSMTAQGIFSEVEDILLANEMRSLFS